MTPKNNVVAVVRVWRFNMRLLHSRQHHTLSITTTRLGTINQKSASFHINIEPNQFENIIFCQYLNNHIFL